MQSNAKESILHALKHYNLSIDDILYVIYAIGHNLNTREFYSCGIESFLKVAYKAKSVFDMNWSYDIKLVGEKFWLEFDYRGDWILCKHPQNPGKYKRPTSDDLLRNLAFDDVP